MQVIKVSNNNQEVNIDFYRETDHKEVKETKPAGQRRKTGRNKTKTINVVITE